MIDLPLDRPTQEFLSHLRSVANGDTAPDAALAARFRDYASTPDAPLFAVRDHSAACNPAVASLVSLLLQTMPPAPGPLADVLHALLAPLPFSEIAQYVPPQVVLGVVQSDHPEIVVDVLHRRCIGHDDADAVRFVADNAVVPLLSKQYLASATSPRVLAFVEAFVRKYPSQCPPSQWAFLQEDPMAHPARYFDIVALLRFYAPSQIAAFAPALLDIDETTLAALDDLDMVALSETALVLMPVFPADWLSPVVRRLLHLLGSDSHQDSLFRMVSHDFLRGLLAAPPSVARLGAEFLAENPSIADSYMESPEKTPLFASLPLGAIPNKDAFFEKHFASLSVARVNPHRFAAMVHLIDDEAFFGLLASSGKMSSSQLKDLSSDRLYEILLALASYDYSAKYLLSELASIVSSHLLVADRAVVNSQIWTMKRDALHKLLVERKVDLGSWKPGLSDCLHELDNGRRVRKVEPQVAVSSETA